MLLLLFCLAVLASNIYSQDVNLTQNYDAVELLAQIFNLERNETVERSMQPVYDQNNFHAQDSLKADFSRNQIKKNRRRKPQRLSPNGFYGSPYSNNYNQNYNSGHFYERPSFATEALSRVTEALTSIALYDDFQCVPRLLCEAAGGGALGSSNVLQSVNGLQPLLTLLSAYSGISSNPLFVFGKAVLLGMSSKGNHSSCRYAYPLCPKDPEKLVHYLNNHNGGFFRFFNTPQREQNVEQFYNHLQGNSPNGNYGLYKPNNPEFGINPNQEINGLVSQYQSYGLKRPYEKYQQNYGFAFPYGDSFKIQKRIQNNPNSIDDSVLHSKWIFPDNVDNNVYNYIETDKRKGKELKFPENSYYDSNQKDETTFTFPNTNRAFYHHLNHYKDDLYKEYNDNHYKVNDEDNDYVTVYVVRGNGDPSKPEIVKLRPGQSL